MKDTGRLPGERLGYEVIDRGITHGESGSRTLAITCLPAISGAVRSASPAGNKNGDVAFYIRTRDLVRPRQICFFRFSTMQNYHFFDDPDASPFTINSADDLFWHISQNKPGGENRVKLTRIKLDNFEISEYTVSMPGGHAIIDAGFCADKRRCYFFAENGGVFYFLAAPLYGGKAEILAETDGTPRSLAVAKTGLFFTAQKNVPNGLDLFKRELNRVSLFFYSLSGDNVSFIDAPPLYGEAICSENTIAVPLLSGGLYFPLAGTAAGGHLIERASFSSGADYFVFTKPDDDFIYAGSAASGNARVLNRHGAARGLGWHNRPSCAFTGDARWVIYGSARTGVPQAYAAYVPDGFLESLETRGERV